MEKDTPLITRDQLATDLRALGIEPGQVILMHASVRTVGWVVGGPDQILQSLFDVLTPAGTLAMYVSWEEWERALVSFSDFTEAQQAVFRKHCPPFDARTSRAMRQWSVLTESLRTWPGAYRSDHPTASVCAVGAQAAWVTADHPLAYGYGYGSPWDKVCHTGGKVLLLGSPLEAVTLLHYAEHIANVPGKRIVRNEVPLLRGGECVWVTFEEFDTTWGIRDLPSEDYFDRIMREYLTEGHGSIGRVGGAVSYLFDAAHLAQFGVAWMEKMWGE